MSPSDQVDVDDIESKLLLDEKYLLTRKESHDLINEVRHLRGELTGVGADGWHEMQRKGWVRFVFQKHDKTGPFNYGIEIYHREYFSTEHLCRGEGEERHIIPFDLIDETISQLGAEDELAMTMEKYPNGFYEVIGHFWFWEDQGIDTPNGPAEYDCGWEIRNEQVLSIKEKTAMEFVRDAEVAK